MNQLCRRLPCSSDPKIDQKAYLGINVLIFFIFLVNEATHNLNGEIHGAEYDNSTTLMEFDDGDTGLECLVSQSHLSCRPEILIFFEVADESLAATGPDGKFLATWCPNTTEHRQFVFGVCELVAFAALEWESRDCDAPVVRTGQDFVEV